MAVLPSPTVQTEAANIAVDGLRAEELRMVEHVEHFEPKLQRI